MQLKQLPEKLGLIPLDTFGFSLEERQHIPRNKRLEGLTEMRGMLRNEPQQKRRKLPYLVQVLKQRILEKLNEKK